MFNTAGVDEVLLFADVTEDAVELGSCFGAEDAAGKESDVGDVVGVLFLLPVPAIDVALASSLDDLCLRLESLSLEWLCDVGYGMGELAELVDIVSDVSETEFVLWS